MYVPEHFNESNRSEIANIVETFPLATLVANGSGGLIANHIPMLTKKNGVGDIIEFHGHISRHNQLFSEIVDGEEVLLIFRAEDSYISPNWYPSKQEHHRQVPTWNYRAVHFYGNIEFTDDITFMRVLLAKLTNHHEAKIGEQNPWKMSDAPRDYIEEMMQGIVGIKITVTGFFAKSKISQNKAYNDYVSVHDKLEETGKDDLSNAMARKVRDLKQNI